MSEFPPSWCVSWILRGARTFQSVAPQLFTLVMEYIGNPLGAHLGSWLVHGMLVQTAVHATPGGLDATWISLSTSPVDHTTAILFLPGGAFIARSPTAVPFAKALLTKLASVSEVVPPVLVLNYPLPASADRTVDSIEQVLHWLRAAGRRVIVAGDSAGGMLAVELALKTGVSTSGPLAGVVGICPWLDLSLSSQAHDRNKHRCVLHRRWLAEGVACYLGNADFESSRALLSPARRGRDTKALADLPSGAVLIVRGLHDILADDGLLLRERALEAGAPCDAVAIVDVRGIHGAHDVMLWPGAHSSDADAAFDRIAQYAMRALDLKSSMASCL